MVVLLGDSLFEYTRYQMSDEMKSEIVIFLKTCVHSDGGYGGGPGHLGHLATTYAAVLCLISLNTEEAFASIDRDLTYKFLLARHQPSGAYTMHLGGEEDIRAPYLALVTASLLKIIDSKLTHLVVEWIMSCQTFEGGFGVSLVRRLMEDTLSVVSHVSVYLTRQRCRSEYPTKVACS
ncbi:hypothetical protein PENTCL1PPCAC_2279 [Pristionchus entomophagus]|uniref:Prenyltransferase alpha-alpha toroid domain-containing protein n=1 Tax=Pristionchus entomophagus TaxID=358040 RepID=A0AAV5SBF1_9BILA|nr:hypothetical protein PENTCL1PPCAC_2279 [Pristionchus entomophagus]